MKTQKAIEWLKAWSATHQNENENVREAVWIGIQALKEVEQYRALGTVEELKEAREKQPKADWIPCEVETPKTNGVYQTVRKVIEGDKVYYLEGASYFDGQNTWHNDIGVNHGRKYPNVVAWQPIQPYKKEGNSHENT